MIFELISIVITGFTILAVTLLERTNNKSIIKLLAWFPAILFAYLIPALITHVFDLDLTQVKLHAFSKNIIMPLAIVLVMSALSIRYLKMIGSRPILVFLSGSFTIAVFPILFLWLTSGFTHYFSDPILDDGYWEGLVTIVGSWIGGSTSQLVLKEITGCDEAIFLTILVMDNVLVNIWTIFMFQGIKRSETLNTMLNIQDPIFDFIPDPEIKDKKSFQSILNTILFCVLAVTVSSLLISGFLAKVILLSIIGLVFGNVFNFWNHQIVIKIGGFLIIAIMAILGLKLNLYNFSLPISVIVFAIIWLVSHYVIMVLIAYMLKLNMAWVPICSMANVGGISTAPAVTKAYNEEWMPHAILLAILSMVTGTSWGLLTIWLFGLL